MPVTVAGITAQPRDVDGAAVPRDELRLTVSFDHDVIDGAPAARFVTRFLDRLQAGDGLPADDSTPAADGPDGAQRP